MARSLSLGCWCHQWCKFTTYSRFNCFFKSCSLSFCRCKIDFTHWCILHITNSCRQQPICFFLCHSFCITYFHCWLNIEKHSSCMCAGCPQASFAVAVGRKDLSISLSWDPWACWYFFHTLGVKKYKLCYMHYCTEYSAMWLLLPQC